MSLQLNEYGEAMFTWNNQLCKKKIQKKLNYILHMIGLLNWIIKENTAHLIHKAK